MNHRWVWSLRSHLSALLLATMVPTFIVVGIAMMVWRAPEVESRSRVALEDEISGATAMFELFLDARQSRLAAVAALLDALPAERHAAVLQSGVGRGRLFDVIYVLSAQGRVDAVCALDAAHGPAQALVGRDLSANALYRAVQAGRASVWSGKDRSVLSGGAGVALAQRLSGGRVLVGELPLSTLLRTLDLATGRELSSMWVVDQRGDILADTEGGRLVGGLSIRNWPLMQALQNDQAPPTQIGFEGERFQVAVRRVQGPHWFLVGRIPMGLDHPETRSLVGYGAVLLLGCLAVGLLIAPFWAQRMARPLRQIVARAAQTTAGKTEGRAWPRGSVAEFNSLAGDLEAMAASLQEGERKFDAVFNAAPVPMGVVDARNGYRVLDVNDAWCRTFIPREAAVGRTAVDLGLWTARERTAMLARLQEGQDAQGTQVGRTTDEREITRGDGQTMRARIVVRRVALPTEELIIWAIVDAGTIRRIERELRDLNQQLEDAVTRRTRALEAANAELSEKVVQLRKAQDQLVQTEKMAALGSLVAGIAHELNTPLGNGVMAVSAVADATRSFTQRIPAGLRRLELQRFVDGVDQGVDIAGRNLRRAAELVRSFKQVAVDQTSAQRRSFELSEVVHEMVTSLSPSFSRTPYRVEVDMPATGLRLHSYPGALGQTLGNLIQNAIVHGFEGRSSGTVRIEASRAEDGRIVLRVCDDGKGIAAEHLGRVFDPFMTTKMGQGGSGLGLHLGYSAVVNLLGGTLTVTSAPEKGTCFEMRLPAQAPRAATTQAARLDPGGAEIWR